MEITVAAVQMESSLFSIDINLERAGHHIQQAACHNSDLVLLPELFPTGLCYDAKLCQLAETVGGRTTRWMLAWSKRTGCHIGGAIVEKCGHDCYDTFVLTSPGGEVFVYRKRFPAFFEKLFFGRGRRTGVFHTELGRIGVMICWDMVHERLVRRIRGRVDWLLISSAWPDLNSGNIPLPGFQHWTSRQPRHRPMALAKRLGVPVVYANATGIFQTRVPYLGLNYRSEYAGCTSIIDGDGRRLQGLERDAKLIIDRIQVPGVEQPWKQAI